MNLLLALLFKLQTAFKRLYSFFKLLSYGVNPFSMTYNQQLKFLEIELIFKKVPGDIVVYDIGANIGVESLFYSNIPKVKKIYSFEPTKNLFEILEQRTEDKNKIQCFNIALGDKNEIAEIYLHKYHVLNSLLPINKEYDQNYSFSELTGKQKVQMFELDHFVKANNLDKPNFIKIDVQGFEEYVLKGGKETIWAADFCLIELNLIQIYEGSMLITDLMKKMKALGFKLIKITDQIRNKITGELIQVDGLFVKFDK